MTNDVINELSGFLLCTFGGIISGFLYDIFRIIRRLKNCGGVSVFIQDVLYWLINTALITGVIFYACSGDVRWYQYAAVVTGFLLYNVSLSKIVIACSVNVIKFTVKCAEVILKCVIYPFFLVYKLFYRPVKYINTKISEKITKIRLTMKHFCFTIKKSVKNLFIMCGKR